MLNQNSPSEKSNVTAFLFCYMLGFFGAHRFYVGRYKTAILQLITLGGLFVWWIIDGIIILSESFADKEGKRLIFQPETSEKYAGLKIRLAAHLVDVTILSVPSIFIGDPLGSILYFISSLAYYTSLTASDKQATIGKRIVGIMVVDAQGNKLSFAHSLGRYLTYIFSYITLGIGFIMIGFTKNHTGLHDKIAGTYVIYGKK